MHNMIQKWFYKVINNPKILYSKFIKGWAMFIYNQEKQERVQTNFKKQLNLWKRPTYQMTKNQKLLKK